MEQKWFEWEREATVHPIILCLEAWGDKTAEYCGRPWPTSYVHYQRRIIHWIDPLDELMEFGEYLIDQYAVPTKRAQLEKDIERLAAEIDVTLERFNGLQTAITGLSDQELLDNYQTIKKRYIDWFAPGALVEPIGLAGEERVRRMLKKKRVAEIEIDQTLSILTTTPKKSFSKKELEELLGIATLIQNRTEGTVTDSTLVINSALAEHSRKYFWIQNNYFTTSVLGVEFFKDQLVALLEKNGDPTTYLKKLQDEFELILSKKRMLIGKLDLSPKQLELIGLLELFAWYQDYRKEYTMKLLHFLDLLLGEIGRRRGVSLKHMKASLSEEVPAILDQTFDMTLLEQRNHEFVAIWQPAYPYKSGQKLEFYTTDSATAWSRFNPHIKHDQEQVEITGSPASLGIVRGKALVTMDAKEAARIEPGEIFVTSMTTPDFTTAMKRAAAIVTNEGGILCHAAMLSREFGVPCVVGTKIATKVIKTGDLIEVDGNQGIVRRL